VSVTFRALVAIVDMNTRKGSDVLLGCAISFALCAALSWWGSVLTLTSRGHRQPHAALAWTVAALALGTIVLTRRIINARRGRDAHDGEGEGSPHA
jgi:hypothetical protein